MPEQPRDMAEMVQSVARTSRDSQKKVIPTIYGRKPEELPTNLREVMRASLRQAVSVGLGLDGVQPGETVNITGQTDIWYTSQGGADFSQLESLCYIISTERR